MYKSETFFNKLFKFLAYGVRALLRCRYKVILKGSEIFQNPSAKLFLPNHQALIDPVILVSQIYRFSTVTPVVFEKYYNMPVAGWYFRNTGAVKVSNPEGGTRNIQVLKNIVRSVYKGLRRKKNIVIYPSGQIAAQGYEIIQNKKAAYHIVKIIPDDVQIIGIRIRGLWGSIWSKKKTGKTPNFFIQLMKGIFFVLVHLVFFVPKRAVTIEFEDITAKAKEIAVQGQKPFNTFLEEFYNRDGEEPAVLFRLF